MERDQTDSVRAYMALCATATETACVVCDIVSAIDQFDSSELASEMQDAFNWWTFAENHPNMTAEEIASAAADGFAVEV